MLNRGEQALSIVELLVAMSVAVVVMAVFSSFFLQTFVRTSEVDAGAVSSAKLNEAFDRLGDDLRAARVKDRSDIAEISTRDDLKTRFENHPDTHSDVKRANGRSLAFLTATEINPQAGIDEPQCVEYRVEKGMVEDPAVWAIVRRVAPACAQVASGDAEVLATLGTAAPPQNVFRYGLMEQNTATPNIEYDCILAWRTGADVDTPQERLRIVRLDVDLSSVAANRGRERTSFGRTSISMWSRLNSDYYYALGCTE